MLLFPPKSIIQYVIFAFSSSVFWIDRKLFEFVFIKFTIIIFRLDFCFAVTFIIPLWYAFISSTDSYFIIIAPP